MSASPSEKPAKPARDLHHLFLVDDDAVGLLQDRARAPDGRTRPSLAAVLALDEVGDQSIGPGR